jgi:hypothetical protein
VAESDAVLAAAHTYRDTTAVKETTLAAVRQTLLGPAHATQALDESPLLVAIAPQRYHSGWSNRVELIFEQFAIRRDTGLAVLVVPLYVYEYLATRPPARAHGLQLCAGLWDPYTSAGLRSLYVALTTARLLATTVPPSPRPSNLNMP